MEGGERDMSYSICRIAKVKASGVTGIQIHDRREKESVSHTNKDIDWSKTHENVDLLEPVSYTHLTLPTTPYV